ncbi:hypothetical protein HID58_063285 [Brassica napus]|uniref:Uncharacterized protein n=1 Tax=Brassica napus TaxID=3708 RepID=A0ABQ8A3T7_BRANA|nr:hypothetical protein HID58_063285 [Brassica napus]
MINKLKLGSIENESKQKNFDAQQFALSIVWFWRGILAGREVIRKGMGWNVRNGESIKVWGETCMALIGYSACSNGTAYSSKSTAPSKGPYAPPLNELAHIRKLIPSAEMLDDELVWLPEKSGQYSTRSELFFS